MLNIFKVLNKSKNYKTGKKTLAPKPASYKDYQSPTKDLSSQGLGRAMWLLAHRVFLYKLAIIALIVFSIFTWGFSLWKWGDYFIFGFAEDKELHIKASQFINYTGGHPAYTPTPFNVNIPRIFAGGVNKYDIVAEAVNSNYNWRVEFDYYFIVAGLETKTQKGLLLPNQIKPLVFLGYESTNNPRLAELVIQNVEWHRVSPHSIKDVKAWQEERLKFEASEVTFISDRNLDGAANVIKFNLNNNSVFGYKNPSFLVGLFSGQRQVGMLTFELPELMGENSTKVDLRSFVEGLQVDSVELFPLIDIYNPDVYLPLPE